MGASDVLSIMRPGPKVTIVIPAHNASQTLAETLSSLSQQTLSNWEAVIVDDGSGDATREIAESYAASDARFRVVEQLPQGVSAARNKGIDLARSDWLLFLDADDWLLPRHLERLTGVLDGDPHLDAVYCGWARVAPDGTIASEQRGTEVDALFPLLARHPVFAVHACIVRKSLVHSAGGFDSAFTPCEDWYLWLKIARAGARFASIPDVLAYYRLRPGSASSDAYRMLESGLRIISIGHSPDPRMPESQPLARSGLPGEELSGAKLQFACWSAGLLLGRGQDARPVLELLKNDNDSQLEPVNVAQSIFYAVPFARAKSPREWTGLWTEVNPFVQAFLSALEQHSAPGFARRASRILERLILKQASLNAPTVIGSTLGRRIELTQPLEDIRVPLNVERLSAHIELEGQRLGGLELPISDGFLPASVLADAIAAQFAWLILQAFFERTVYRELQIEHAPGGASFKRGSVLLGEGIALDDTESWQQAHDQFGWTVFLQELWGRSDWSNARFYDTGAQETGSTELRVEEDRFAVQVSDELPSIITSNRTVRAIVSVGGSAIGSIRIPVEGNCLSSQAQRVAITSACGFELCRAAVREGLLGRRLDEPPSLRVRLAAAAHATPLDKWKESFTGLKSNMPLSSDALRALSRVSQAHNSARVIGMRGDAPIGTSWSRRAVIPSDAAAERLTAAEQAGEPIVEIEAAEGESSSLIYAPDLIGDVPSDLGSRSIAPPPREPRAENADFSARQYFETVFATRSDPWDYTGAYEEIKYGQTLRLIPNALFKSALEIGCAEGHFTSKLAARVGQLVAADISQIALERAARRCAQFENISWLRLDLVNDPLPGSFDLIVCSENLYYLRDRQELDCIGRKLAAALKPGGYLLTAHAHLVIDAPAEPGFSWNHPFGGRVIGETIAALPGLKLVSEIRTDAYRIQLFQRRSPVHFSFQREPEPKIEFADHGPLPPEIARQFLKTGGEPSRGADWNDRTSQLPIMMYHRIAPGGSRTIARYRITPAVFEEQLRYLREAGYHSISLAEWRAAMESRHPAPGRAVVLTFDDGDVDFQTYAWPLLKRYGFSATVFLVAGEIGGWNIWDGTIRDRFRLLGWAEIHQLQQEGVEFGAHSFHHVPLTALSNADVVKQGARARAVLEHELGTRVEMFAYPYGDVDATVQQLIGASGYVYGLTCHARRSRLQDNLLDLPRLEVSGVESFRDFVLKLGS